MLEYLLQRVDDLEQLVEDMKVFMKTEEKGKVDLFKEIEDKEEEVADFQEKDKMVISKKVKKELKSHLEAAAQKILDIEKEKLELERRYNEQGFLLAQYLSYISENSMVW